MGKTTSQGSQSAEFAAGKLGQRTSLVHLKKMIPTLWDDVFVTENGT
jgi:hypothetical protein